MRDRSVTGRKEEHVNCELRFASKRLEHEGNEFEGGASEPRERQKTASKSQEGDRAGCRALGVALGRSRWPKLESQQPFPKRLGEA